MKTVRRHWFARQWFALSATVLICLAYGWADGAADFKQRCTPCHGSKGSGDTKLGQNLHVRDLGSADVQKQSDAELTGIIAKGKSTMPGYEDKLSRDQIRDVVKFIRALKK